MFLGVGDFVKFDSSFLHLCFSLDFDLSIKNDIVHFYLHLFKQGRFLLSPSLLAGYSIARTPVFFFLSLGHLLQGERLTQGRGILNEIVARMREGIWGT